MDGLFPDTPWSLIAQAVEGEEEKRTHLKELLHQYWPPVYSAVRYGWKLDHATTERYVQAFLHSLLTREKLTSLNPHEDRFRDYVRTELAIFMDNPEAASGQTHATGEFPIPDDLDPPETDGSPADVFDEQWTLLIIRRAISRLKQTTRDHPQFFAVFDASDIQGLTDENSIRSTTDLDLQNIHAILHEARQRFRRCLISEVQAYTNNLDHAQEELKWLLH